MKKILATVAAVALTLAMVAWPSIAASAEAQTCDKIGYTKVAPEAASGSADLYAGATLIGKLTWSAGSVAYDLQTGWSISLCIKSGSQTGDVDTEKITTFGPLTGKGSTLAIAQDISHIGYTATYTPPPADIVTLSAIPQGEQCDAANEGEVLPGSIALTLKVNGTDVDLTSPAITSLTVAKDGGAATPVTSLTLGSLSDGSYVFSLTVATGYSGTITLDPVVVSNKAAADCVEDDPDCSLDGGGTVVSVDCFVEVTGTATDQVCVPSGDESIGTFTKGRIELSSTDADNIESISYVVNAGSPVAVDPADFVAGKLTISGLEPGDYEFTVVPKSGFDIVKNPFTVTVKADNNPECKKVTICHWNEGGKGELGSFNIIDVSVQSIVNPNGHATHELDVIPPFTYQGGSFPGLNYVLGSPGCGDLPTRGPLVPGVDFTDPTCSADGSYTLTSPEPQEGLPAKTVTWYVNDVETEPGTYKAVSGDKVTIRVVATVGYTFETDEEGFVTEITYPEHAFNAPTTCDLKTLALTGSSDTTPALALTAFLGLLGLAMVRSGIRVNRSRQEA